MFSLLATANIAVAQTAKYPSLTKISTMHNSADSADLYYSLSKYYLNKNTDSSIIFGKKAIATAKRANNARLTVKSLVTTGKALLKATRYYDGLQYYFEGLPICNSNNLTGLTAKIYNDLGIAYGGINDYTLSAAYFKKALSVQQDAHDSDKTPQYQIICNLAETFKSLDMGDSTRAYSYKALAMANAANDSLAQAIIFFNIGDAWLNQKNYQLALKYVDSSMGISASIADYEGIAYCNNALALIYYGLGQTSKSIQFAKLALQQSINLGLHPKSKAYNILYLNFKALKNYDAALKYRNLEVAVNDSLNNIEAQKNMASLQLKYDVRNKQEEIDALTFKTTEYNNKRRTALYTAVIFGFLLVGVSFAYLRIRKLQRFGKLQNKEILRQKNKLEELNETKNKLFSIVSHDLKGPFLLVRNISSLIRTKEISEIETSTVLTKLDESFSNTFTLLDNLLYWANTQVEGINAAPSVFNIWQVLNQCIRSIETPAEEKSLTIETNETTSPISVIADRHMIEIAVRNLLDNAVKFANSGGNITLFVEEQNEAVNVTISNTGPGIPLSQQKEIFSSSSFYSTPGTAGERGHGLGLKITKELVEKNGGSIWLVSQPGEWCKFTFTTPSANSSFRND